MIYKGTFREYRQHLALYPMENEIDKEDILIFNNITSYEDEIFKSLYLRGDVHVTLDEMIGYANNFMKAKEYLEKQNIQMLISDFPPETIIIDSLVNTVIGVTEVTLRVSSIVYGKENLYFLSDMEGNHVGVFERSQIKKSK
jgi:hypothetical protein